MARKRINISRSKAAIAVVVTVGLVFGVRLVDLQVVNGPALAAQSQGKRAVPVQVPALRGSIVDANGQVLAVTDERYDVQLSPKNTKVRNGIFYRGNEATTAEEAFAEIAEVIGQKPEEVKKIVDDALAEDPDSDFAYVKRSVDLTTLNRLKQLGIPWLTFSSVFNRVYPNGAVAGNIIGFVGSDGAAQAGVELSQDECLTGESGVETYERSADGVQLPGSRVIEKPVRNGGQLQLTIDRDLQWELQQRTNEIRDKAQAEWVMQVLMNVKTGELVAVAEDYSVDPNNVAASEPSHRDSRAFLLPYEPGSTYKTVTMAALLDQGQITPETQNLTPWTWNPEPNVLFRDSFAHADTPWTATGILERSSNVGTAMLGSRLDRETRFNYMTSFGLGRSTQAGMPFEDAGLLYPAEQWDAQTSYNVMFGQGVSSTIVQTAAIYQTIANNGVYVPPTLIKNCTASDGEIITHDAGESHRVISEGAAQQLQNMLENVANADWPGKEISIDGYRLAGKTGTAEQSDGQGGLRSDFVHSFAGYFPADNPQYVLVTSVAFPKNGHGGVAAVGTWKQSAEAAIRHFKIEPSTGSFQDIPEEY
ncbi:peptidoglycan D,D-transpeptidase FtsI family protein [Canibacter zhoujuaniae]|uniref:peptidoglycan D,D-transpeptidase FtsI family protein n=1 Tax=Canibacter zhoujuaniae TaxID=2708343 RepID=UPI001422020E|nr:penicillin-binding protein 2 [Canibacter zhoujuaniae]